MENRNHVVRYRPIIAAIAVSLTLINGPGAHGLSNGTTDAVGSVSAQRAAAPALPTGSTNAELAFEPNVGQAPAEARFIARGPAYSLMLTDDGPVILGRGNQADNAEGRAKNRVGTAPMPHGKSARGRALIARAEQLRARAEADARSAPARQAAADGGAKSTGADGASSETVINFRFIGATASPAISGLDKLPSTTSYLIGADPSEWHSAVPNFAKVKYQGVYPGIDLVYYGSKGNLEYDAVVAPGADPAAIQLEVDGAVSLSIDAGGQLVAETPAGPIRQTQPHIYQMIDGARHQVTGGYQLTGPNRAGFTIGQYDHNRELVIDPDITYTTTLGGSKATFADAIAVDSQGNAYVSGGTSSSDFPTKNPLDGSLKGMQNAFITKLDPQGNVLFSTFLGGSGIDEAFGIGVDATGIYLDGATSSRDFPTTSGGLQSLGGGLDAFVAKLSLDGSSLVYSSLFGGSSDDIAFGIALSPGQGLPAGSVVITGLTKSTNLPTKNPFQPTDLNPRGSAFVSAFDPTGKALIYSSYLGGSGADAANGIAIDAQGNAYITGTTNSSNFPTTAGVFQPSARGGLETFISAVSPAGTLTASSFLGGTGDDQGVAIAIVANAPGDQDVVVACSTTSTGLSSGPNPVQTAFMGQTDAYVAEIDHALQNLKNGTYLGGGNTIPISVAVDSVKNICVGGATDDAADIPTIFPAAFSEPVSGKNNAFLTIFNFTMPSAFPDNVISSSAFSLGSNNSDVTACTLVRSPATGLKTGGAGGGTVEPADTNPVPKTTVRAAGTAGDQNHQGTTVVSEVIGGVEFKKDAVDRITLVLSGPAINTNEVGQEFEFRLTVRNTSTVPLKNLVIKDTFPFPALVDFGASSLRDSRGTLSFSFFDDTSNPFTSSPFDLEPGQTVFAAILALARKPAVATNTATLEPFGLQAEWTMNITPHPAPVISSAKTTGKKLEVGGANLAPAKSARTLTAAANGPVILLDGAAQKTVPDDTFPDAILIAPKAGKKIAPGQTVMIQVQFPDGSTTNSISYTRPTG